MMALKSPTRQDASVVIIGAGISGICTAIDLIRRNNTRDFIILEKGSRVGGTWSDNQYPGCCCDVWSHLYSFSFEGNPDWSTEYPGQEEIHAYLVKVAEKWGLFKHIRFSNEVEQAEWNAQDNNWKVETKVLGGKDSEYAQSYIYTSDFLVSAVGQLNYPRYPSIEGIESFQGKMMHTARWDSSYNFEGKRVAVIGNGATAAQAIPELTKTAKSVSVFQRTPNWIIPRQDKPISQMMRYIYRHFPVVRRQYRTLLMDYRETFYEFVVTGSSALAEKYCFDLMNLQIPTNSKLREELTPKYSTGCKRIILSDDFYVAMNSPHVTLRTSPIEKFTPTGIRTGGTEHEFDLIVLATGFRTTEFMYPMKISGTEGRGVEDIWQAQGGARAYLGMTVQSLPNFAMLYGPNTNLGHNSIILMIEAQSRYINTLIAPVLRARAKGASLAILPQPQRLASYNTEIQERLSKTAFADPNCTSWYKNENGIITNNWYGNVVEYQKRTSTVDWDDYTSCGTNKGAVLPKGKEVIGRVFEESRPLLQRLALPALVVVVLVCGGLYRTAIKRAIRL